MQALRSSALRAARPRVAAPAPMMRSVAQKRLASTMEEATGKAKEAAEAIKPSHHKPSSDVPWMVGSVLFFAPLLVWMTSPADKNAHHEHPKKEKVKPHLRFAPGTEDEREDPTKQQEAPEEFGETAGEGRPHGDGDKGLRARQDEDGHHQDKQKSPEGEGTGASNHASTSGLKGDPEKFNAAARGSQIANQSGGGEAARDPKALVAAARQSSADDNTDSGYKSGEVPETTGKNVGAKLSERQEQQPAEKHEKDSGANKDEQQ